MGSWGGPWGGLGVALGWPWGVLGVLLVSLVDSLGVLRRCPGAFRGTGAVFGVALGLLGSLWLS